VDLYVKCGDWTRAAETAKERGDKAKLEQLRRMAPNGIAQRDIDEVIRRPGK
jgi:vacuolar protein sorting-associated protein 16